MDYNFKGGVKLSGRKLSKSKAISTLPSPNRITVPAKIGSCKVKIGESVSIGQIIAFDGENYTHSPLSGTVADICEITDYTGKTVCGIIIDNDFRDSVSDFVVPFSKKISEATREELIEKIKTGGITYGKEEKPLWKKIAECPEGYTAIINCMEIEPFLTSTHRIMLEKTDEIIGGSKILLRALNGKRIVFAVADDKEDVAEMLMDKFGANKLFKVKILKTKYPQGNEKLLSACIKKKKPYGINSPNDVQSIVFFPEELSALYDLFIYGVPFIKKTITVSGEAIGEPNNVNCPIGTNFEEIINFAGGVKFKPDHIIAGGPMTGETATSTEVPVSKSVEAILCTMKEKNGISGNCIRCGECVDSCPMKLMPLYLAKFAKRNQTEKLKLFGIDRCIECGTCSYVCPSKVNVANEISRAKELLNTKED